MTNVLTRAARTAVLLSFSALAAVGYTAGADVAIEVSTDVSTPVVVPGGFGDAACDILNLTSNVLSVDFRIGVTYADGTVQEFTGLGSPAILPPGNGTVRFLFFIVDPAAAPGPAVFTCKARARKEGTPGPPFAFDTDTSPLTVLLP